MMLLLSGKTLSTHIRVHERFGGVDRNQVFLTNVAQQLVLVIKYKYSSLIGRFSESIEIWSL